MDSYAARYFWDHDQIPIKIFHAIWPEIFGYPHSPATEMDSRIRLRNDGFWKAQRGEPWRNEFNFCPSFHPSRWKYLVIVLRNARREGNFEFFQTLKVNWKIKLKRAIFYCIGTNFIGTFILNFVFCLLLSVIEYAEMNNKKKLNNGKINLKKEVIDVRVYKIEILALD